jgi:hypothetical protein
MQGTRTGGKTDTSCIIDPDASKTTISLKMCGNGIVDKEQGEECDPGPNPKTDCCDPTTCKLRTNAVCDPDSSDCCTDQCGFAPATRVCRPSKDDRCDTQETCSGNSSICPADVVVPNGAWRISFISVVELTNPCRSRAELRKWRPRLC